MPLPHRMIAYVTTCTLVAASAGCTSTKSIRVHAGPTAPPFGEVKPADTVEVAVRDGRHDRLVVQQIGANASISPAGAPPVASTPTEADKIRRRVKEGQKVSIFDDQGRALTGRISELRADALTLLKGRERTDVPYDRILRIDRPHDGATDGALIGFGIGAGLGLVAALAAATDDSGWGSPDPSDVALIAPLVFGGIGAGIGLGLDASIRREPNLYRRQAATRMTLSPVLGRSRRGVAISVSW